MTLEQLKYMRAIVETGSFRAASEAVFRSQSSLSISIQKLENELGFKLFNRDGYRPELTSEGSAIYQKALLMLKKAQEMQELANHLASGAEAELRLAISGIVPITPIIDVLNQIAESYPQTRVTLLIENLGGTMERLIDDDADIAITDSYDHESNFESLTITEVPFASVVPATSRWAQQAETISERELEHETIIVVRDTSYHSPRISKGLIEGAPQWVVNDFATKRQIICSGKGWGRMPIHLVQDEIDQGKLTALRSPSFPQLIVPVHMVRKKGRPQGPVGQALWSSIQKVTWQA